MNLKKIGAYIASKRKALGMTQAELAKKLGMSDKSVSKWERGVCLPDVSVYIPLCDILGISINEFIAGEDLDEKILVHQSEANIIAVTEEGDQKRKKLKQIFLGLTVVYFVIVCCMGAFQDLRFGNSIEPIKSSNTEVVLAETIFGESDFFLYRYDLDNGFSNIAVYLTEYQKGQIVKKSVLASGKLNSPRSVGQVIAFQDSEDEQITVIIADEEGKITAEAPVLSKIREKKDFSRSVRQLNQSVDVSKGNEVNLICFIYSRGELISLPIEELIQDGNGSENDYMYLLSVKVE